MLILSRNCGQVLKIGDDTEVCILSVQGNQVKIGVTAPKEVPVHREEIYQRIREEKEPGAGARQSFDVTQVYSGHVTELQEQKNFGFIYAPGLPNHVFFHASNVKDGQFDQLEEGASVIFRVERSNRGLGLAAVDVAVEG